MSAKNTIDVAVLRSLLTYEPETGLLRWKDVGRAGVTSGMKAGFYNGDGYIQVCIDGRYIMAHRIIWALVHGVWPDGQIDHKNGTRDDNRIANLRDVDAVTNGQNKLPSVAWGQSKLMGAQWNKQRQCWHSAIKPRNGKRIFLGLFDTAEEAHAAYMDARKKFHETDKN